MRVLLFVFLLVHLARSVHFPLCSFEPMPTLWGTRYSEYCPGQPIGNGNTQHAPNLEYPIHACREDYIVIPPMDKNVPMIQQIPYYGNNITMFLPDCVTCYSQSECKGEGYGYYITESEIVCIVREENYIVQEPEDRVINDLDYMAETCIVLLNMAPGESPVIDTHHPVYPSGHESNPPDDDSSWIMITCAFGGVILFIVLIWLVVRYKIQIHLRLAEIQRKVMHVITN